MCVYSIQSLLKCLFFYLEVGNVLSLYMGLFLGFWRRTQNTGPISSTCCRRWTLTVSQHSWPSHQLSLSLYLTPLYGLLKHTMRNVADTGENTNAFIEAVFTLIIYPSMHYNNCTMKNCYTGLQILYTLLQNVAQEKRQLRASIRHTSVTSYKHIFSVVTDTSHTAGQFWPLASLSCSLKTLLYKYCVTT